MGKVNVQSEQGRGKGKRQVGGEVSLADLRMDPELTLNHLGY